MLIPSWRRFLYFFLLVPASVAILVFVAVDWVPKNYVSEIEIDFGVIGDDSGNLEMERWKNSTSRRVKELFESPAVISQVTLSSGTHLTPAKVKSRLESNTQKISVRVTASSASEAKLLAEALLRATISASQPTVEWRARLKADYERVESNILLLHTAFHRLSEYLPNSSNPHEFGALASALTQVMEYKATLEKQQTLTTMRLEGIPEGAIVIRPTLPAEATGPRRVLWSMIAALGTLCLMISIILLQRAWLDFQLVNRSTNSQPVLPQDRKSDSCGV